MHACWIVCFAASLSISYFIPAAAATTASAISADGATLAKTQPVTRRIQLNVPPIAPTLIFPPDNAVGLVKPIAFNWNKTLDPNGDGVGYRLCVWGSGENANLNTCDTKSFGTLSLGRGFLFAMVGFLAVCLAFVVLIIAGLKKRSRFVNAMALVGLAAVLFAFYLGATDSKTVSKTLADLEPGKIYLWKVIAEDGKGGASESETRHFAIE